MRFTEQIKRWSSLGYTAAVDCKGREMTYADLDEKSDALAAYLHETVTRKRPVIIRGDKENDCLVCMVAALKAGNPYAFVPQWFPLQKLLYIVEVSGCALVISMADDLEDGFPVPVVLQENLRGICTAKQSASNDWETRYDETACIFFTSGSTGAPKGVMSSLSALESMEQWWTELFCRGIDNPRILNCASYGFTASLQNVYSFMMGLGGTLFAVDRATTADFQKMLEMIMEIRPNYLDCTPSFAELCMQDKRFGSDYLPEMAVVSVGGEPVSERIAALILKRFHRADLINGYGATEMTSGPIACIITPEMVERGGAMPIGYAAKGTKAYVVDSDRNPVENGTQGELVIVSDMVSDGYLNDPEKNAKVFFRDEEGRKGYYTGDLVRMEDDGLILYDGRTNNMVKIGGYRVEMEEVELRINHVLGVANSIAFPIYREDRAVMIGAHVILEESQQGGLPGVVRIKKALQQVLPAYMIPQRIKFVSEFPKNQNGKIDRPKIIEENRIREKV